MKLKVLYLCNFRNYKEATLHFSSKVNVFQGANAQGKTNLLEAIYFLATGRSFRTHHLQDLLYFGAPSFYIEAHFEKNGVTEVLKVTCDGKERKIVYNQKAIPSLSALLGLLLAVLLCPEDDELIRGQPSTRRRFLDQQIAEANPLYLHHLSRYYKALKHRNYLLKHRQLDSIEIFEKEMAISSAFLASERVKALRDLELKAQQMQKELSSQSDHLSLLYRPSVRLSSEDPQEEFFSHFKRLRRRDLEMGNTLSGPHKDDISILLGGRDAKGFASEGQLRSSIVSLRLAEWTRLKELTEETPLFCVDDIALSLDKSREKHLTTLLSTLGQVFITTPRFDLDLPSDCKIFTVESGSLR